MRATAVLFIFSFLLGASAFASSAGVVCGRNDGPFDGGKAVFRLIPTAGQSTYQMSITISKADGSSSRTIDLGKDLSCKFSKIDPVVALCEETHEENSTTHLSNYLKIVRITQTAISDYEDGTNSYYSLTIEAPTLSDADLNSLVWYGADPMTLNLKNKTFKLDFNIDNHGLSACKSL